MYDFKFRIKLASKHVNDLIVRRMDADKNYLLKGGLKADEFTLFRKVASSDYLQRIYHQQKLATFIQPQVFTIKKNVNEINRTCTFTYVPIARICSKYLQNSHLVNQILQDQVDLPTADLSPFDRRIKGKLQIEFYLDECVIGPSGMIAQFVYSILLILYFYIGVFNQSQKYLFVYVTIANLPYHHRVHSDDIETLLVVNKKELNSLKLVNPFAFLFSQLKTDFQYLVNNGITVHLNGHSHVIFPTITSIVADNLGQYEFLGMKKSFNIRAYCCRFCGLEGDSKDRNEVTIQTHDPSLQLPLLDESNLSQSAHQNLTTARTFIFDQIDGLSKWNCTPPDPFHDLNEGVLPDSIQLILTSLVISTNRRGSLKYNLDPAVSTPTEISNRELILHKVDLFKFAEGKCSLKWSSKGFSISGKGMMVSTFHEFILLLILYSQFRNWKHFYLLMQFSLVSFNLIGQSTNFTYF